jgi:hypothetical protein
MGNLISSYGQCSFYQTDQTAILAAFLVMPQADVLRSFLQSIAGNQKNTGLMPKECYNAEYLFS